MKPKRVCFYTLALGAGGAERQLVTLARTLKAGGMEVRVLCGSLEGKHGHYLPLLTQAGIPAETFIGREHLDLGLALVQKHPERYAGLAGLPLDHATVLCLAGCLSRMSPDIVHCYLDVANCRGGCAALCAGVPGILLSARSTDPANRGSPGLAACTQPVYKFLLRRPHVALEANSGAGARDYAHWLGIAREHVIVTPNGVEVEEFLRQQIVADDEIRSLLGMPADAKLVFWIGRNVEEKRPSDMLAVAARVCKKLPRAKFVVLGQGLDSAENFVGPMREHGLDNEVLFLGCREDVFSLLSVADAILLTSRVEGFPNALLEAMYAGVPVVATEVGGVPDLVKHGEHGFLHQVDDIDGMAHSLLRLLCSPGLAKSFGEAGKKRIESGFTARNLKENALNTYAGLLRQM
jgi:glycosyltransferase involved in cell wall biosynthesis